MSVSAADRIGWQVTAHGLLTVYRLLLAAIGYKGKNACCRIVYFRFSGQAEKVIKNCKKISFFYLFGKYNINLILERKLKVIFSQ